MRPAQASDREAIVALWEEVEALHARLQPKFFRGGVRGERPELRRALAGRDQVLLVAVDAAGQVRGLSRVQIYETPPAPIMVAVRRGHIEEMVVSRRFRRTGCGRALTLASAEWARRRGARQLLLTVWAGNAAAERFYAAMGFSRITQVLGTEL